MRLTGNATPECFGRKGLSDNDRADPRCRASPKLMFRAATLLAGCRTYLPALPKLANLQDGMRLYLSDRPPAVRFPPQ
jgi:hypothetical protein